MNTLLSPDVFISVAPGNEADAIDSLSLAVIVNVTVLVCDDALRLIVLELAPTEMLGATPSITKSALAPREPVSSGAARVRMAALPAASWMVPPLRLRAVEESWSRSAEVSPS